MSKVQTRRTISLNRAVYDAVKAAATRAGVTRSEFVTSALRLAVADLPATHHAAPVLYEAITERSAECECGADKRLEHDACEHCAFLDGDRSWSANVIAALRGTDGLSRRELCEALAMNGEYGNGQRTVSRWLETLMEQGRVRRYWREAEAGSTTMTSHRNGATRRAFPVGCWVYALDGVARRAA